MAAPTDGIAFINGEYGPLGEASVPLLDPGFTRGDAVYDTVSVWGGNFFRLDDHIDRFFRSCATARLAPPVTPDSLKGILAECVHQSTLDAAYVQMISTRGKFQNPLRRDPRECKNTIMAFAMPYIWIVQPERQMQGIDLAIATGNRRTPPESVDPRMKNFGWLDFQRGLMEGRVDVIGSAFERLHPKPRRAEGRNQAERDRGLADAALLVEHRNCGHGPHRRACRGVARAGRTAPSGNRLPQAGIQLPDWTAPPTSPPAPGCRRPTRGPCDDDHHHDVHAGRRAEPHPPRGGRLRRALGRRAALNFCAANAAECCAATT